MMTHRVSPGLSALPWHDEEQHPVERPRQFGTLGDALSGHDPVLTRSLAFDKTFAQPKALQTPDRP
ncbi:MAG TPA: hypothetical protein PLV05_08700 [Verrucomicrobiota bacterium]|nr:hypothetical protein [Verrucomicrobiota bacterium]HRR64791.1 hypothetical protein [Candidatus Paceibacterota bacterium]HOF70734.1 hypothetical protein [Verrucomicrobiota bacterium]HOM45425.1 hypothetical protein [Verrucomicrobiota bacterium]HOQ55637.1 hypothetical protein [Verrucomicrobiota bacterium]